MARPPSLVTTQDPSTRSLHTGTIPPPTPGKAQMTPPSPGNPQPGTSRLSLAHTPGLHSAAPTCSCPKGEGSQGLPAGRNTPHPRRVLTARIWGAADDSTLQETRGTPWGWYVAPVAEARAPSLAGQGVPQAWGLCAALTSKSTPKLSKLPEDPRSAMLKARAAEPPACSLALAEGPTTGRRV